MEETLLLLMSNPDTTPEQLKQAAEAYANITKQLHEAAQKTDESIYNEGKPKKEQA
jgi:predicted ATP-grasp superfamily ATP-dependent carboligase